MASDGPSVLESAGVPGASAGESDEGHADAHGVAGWLLWGGETVGDVSPVTNDALRGCHAIHLAAPSGMWQGLVSALCGSTLAMVLPRRNFYVRFITLFRHPRLPAVASFEWGRRSRSPLRCTLATGASQASLHVQQISDYDRIECLNPGASRGRGQRTKASACTGYRRRCRAVAHVALAASTLRV